MTCVIRRARPAEHVLLADIELSAGRRFASVGLGRLSDGEPVSLESVTAIARCGAVFVAATADDTPVGFVLVGFLDRAAHIHELAVAEEHGRRGLGRRLVEEACRFGVAERATAVTLSTFRDVPFNGPFYEWMGFRFVPRNEWTPAFFLLHDREIEMGLPVERRGFMRKDLT